MNTAHENTPASLCYSEAYSTHYTKQDLAGAIRAYDSIIASHPGSPEAEYSRSQLRNIIKSVVPSDVLLAAEVELAQKHLNPGGPNPANSGP